MQVIQHFGVDFIRLSKLLTTAELLAIAEATHCQDFAYIHFENPKKKKFYHNHNSLLRAIRNLYHQEKLARPTIVSQLVARQESLKERVKKAKK
ncbi:hypothetical protein SIN8267_01022 [Sinobacterium norvegicum]|uniref:Uncharacterized protein n=1 Tax=Sinobacterium norvegicum TaxID=1641715 RepID=A0ABM9ACK1_9GAMM|nr:hypothetical protein [Sinobacterium norvegicum]CAH0990921.1 hypothetical protein SIN8267_01022 [Sinobacterium norvegicum]